MMRVVIAVACAIACVAGVLAYRSALRGPVAPDFTLTDQDGRAYTLSAHHGRAIALFFGYTHCPDVCPTTLAALARAKKRLGTTSSALDIVFITVDPKRDTPAAIKRYVGLFGAKIIGLTGSEPQLDMVYAAYHVYHQSLPSNGSAAGYLVAHSSSIQFIGPGQHLRGTADWSDTPDELVAAMKHALS